MVAQDLNVSISAIEEFCRRYPIRELAVFGSALREDFTPSSDLDLLVEFEPNAEVGFMTLSKMQRELSKIFNRQVDLVPKEGLKARVRGAVLSSARVLYAA
jgi:predicted nucleotidyltransferase